VESNPNWLTLWWQLSCSPVRAWLLWPPPLLCVDWILKAVRLDGGASKPEQMVGTKDDANLFKTAKEAVTRLQTGNYSPEDKEKATQEATHLVNTLLEQTTTAGGEMNPAALKQASTFFASPEFGRMALAGKVDKQTAANAQHVFQTQYEPAVKNAIVRKLEDNNIANAVDVKVVGNNCDVPDVRRRM
jgi:hypothetical protein